MNRIEYKNDTLFFNGTDAVPADIVEACGYLKPFMQYSDFFKWIADSSRTEYKAQLGTPKENLFECVKMNGELYVDIDETDETSSYHILPPVACYASVSCGTDGIVLDLSDTKYNVKPYRIDLSSSYKEQFVTVIMKKGMGLRMSAELYCFNGICIVYIQSECGLDELDIDIEAYVAVTKEQLETMPYQKYLFLKDTNTVFNMMLLASNSYEELAVRNTTRINRNSFRQFMTWLDGKVNSRHTLYRLRDVDDFSGGIKLLESFIDCMGDEITTDEPASFSGNSGTNIEVKVELELEDYEEWIEESDSLLAEMVNNDDAGYYYGNFELIIDASEVVSSGEICTMSVCLRQ